MKVWLYPSYLERTTIYMKQQAYIDPNVLETVVRIIADHPLAKALEYSYLEDIARDAFHQDKLQDHEWLIQKLEETTKQFEEDRANKNFETEVLAHITISAPAAIKSREDLTPILEKHQLWVESVLNPKINNYYSGRANLRGANLSGFDLTQVNLSCADLREANLEDCDLSHANLSRASLAKAKLTGAKLFQTNLRGADLHGAEIAEDALKESRLH